jgi:hypothetical protein
MDAETKSAAAPLADPPNPQVCSVILSLQLRRRRYCAHPRRAAATAAAVALAGPTQGSTLAAHEVQMRLLQQALRAAFESSATRGQGRRVHRAADHGAGPIARLVTRSEFTRESARLRARYQRAVAPSISKATSGATCKGHVRGGAHR